MTCTGRMSRIVSDLIYRAAGSPIGDAWAGDSAGTCRLCGAVGVGQSFERWVKPTFTDRDLLLPGEIICTACLFCAQERTIWMAERTGREKGQRMRTYSHAVLAGRWYVLSKAEKPRMRGLLLQQPDVAVIADSGQKHLIFRARAGWWQFELHPPIRPDTKLLADMLAVTDALYAGGAGKDEVLMGHYDQRSIAKIGIDAWRSLESICKAFRGGPMFALAIFLTLRPETTDDGDTVTDTVGGRFDTGQIDLL